ncbi:unnamed protein product [Parajaminaea phylloscopi]
MDPGLQKALLDRVYDKRKAATLDLERQVREALSKGDRARVNLIIQQLCGFLQASQPQNANARNGGLIGLAGISIALGAEIAPYLEQIVPPVLACFTDPDSKIRYFACESFYNIAKVCKGEVLIYFNDIFDALSKLAADSELSVKNGAELLDRLLKDIVCETAPEYVSHFQDIPHIRSRQDAAVGYSGGAAELDVAREKAHPAVLNGLTQAAHLHDEEATAANRVFSLARFVPLLSERMYVLSPFTRNYLVSWITVLDSVPDLELVSYLPHFLDGLLKYLSDPNTDVRLATANVLADFLREIKEAAQASAARAQHSKDGASKAIPAANADGAGGSASADDESQQQAVVTAQTPEDEDGEADAEVEANGQEGEAHADGSAPEQEELWIPGREVRIDFAAIIEILINHIAYPDEEIQATTLQWIAELLLVVRDVVVPFTPRLIPAILPNLAHHSPAIQTAANDTNENLFQVIQDLPGPIDTRTASPTRSASPSEVRTGRGGNASQAGSSGRQQGANSPPLSPRLGASGTDSGKDKETVQQRRQTLSPAVEIDEGNRRPDSVAHADLFDYQTTVNMLTLQLLDQHEETRVNALEWLIMLHQKASDRVLTMHDGTFPALLKTLSDPSEDVIRCDLRLLAQISSASEDAYFSSFMTDLLSLFSTDRRLLETRGSLIIRQLCVSLHTDRIFRTLSELLEKDEDLEFASIMVQNLNVILITSPELVDFRRRLKNHDTKDGQQLLVSLYRSWCHNAVATFSLCLLAQAYEHASNLLSIFADLEITVAMLIQIDKLVQLLESPIFTALRLQLLDPDKNPYLLKALYGLLMLLPQSSAFATLRNRLSAVSNVNTGIRSTYAQTARSKVSSRDEIKWPELLAHFRMVQGRHERARRANQTAVSSVPPLGLAAGPGSSAAEALVPGLASTPLRSPTAAGPTGNGGSRLASALVTPPARRRVGPQAGSAAMGSSGTGRTASKTHSSMFGSVSGSSTLASPSTVASPPAASTKASTAWFGLPLSGATASQGAAAGSSNARSSISMSGQKTSTPSPAFRPKGNAATSPGLTSTTPRNSSAKR